MFLNVLHVARNFLHLNLWVNVLTVAAEFSSTSVEILLKRVVAVAHVQAVAAEVIRRV